jgi:serine/threonine protein kinase
MSNIEPLDADAKKFNMWNALIETKGERIGSGTYGDVYRIESEDSKPAYALKMYKFNEPHDGEVDILREFYKECSAHLLCFKDVVYSKDNTPLYLVTDFLEGYITLLEYFANLSQQPIEGRYEGSYDVLRSCVEVLKWFHKKGFAHLDIKADNIMIHPKTKNIKLIDFGRTCSNHVVCYIDAFDDVEDYKYLAPEFRNMGKDGGSVSLEEAKSMDVYSMGYMIVDLTMELFGVDKHSASMIIKHCYGIPVKFDPSNVNSRELNVSSITRPANAIPYISTLMLKWKAKLKAPTSTNHFGRTPRIITPKVLFPSKTPKALIGMRQATPKAHTKTPNEKIKEKRATPKLSTVMREKRTSKPKGFIKPKPMPPPKVKSSPIRTPYPKIIATPSPSI